MWTRILDRLGRFYDPQRHHDLLTRIWQDERWFDTPRQRAGADTVLRAMQDAGLQQAEIVSFAADGRTRYQDWTTKMAWDCRRARLSAGDEVFADREAVPCATVSWSGPLADCEAEVVDIDRLERVDRDSVGGRIVLGSEPPLAIRKRVIDHGALAVASDWIGVTVDADDNITKWCNGWNDGSAGWYFRAYSRPLPGFCLSPAAGARLRRLMRERPGLRLRAFCESRLYAGEAQCVDAVIPGRDPAREIWLFAHACEPGANDNASGVATIVEAAQMLRRAIDAGELPRPQCSIRVISTEECLGMVAFATLRPELRKRALAGLNVDSVGDRCDASRPHVLLYGPYANPSMAWPVAGVLGKILEERADGDYALRHGYQMPAADDMIADPACGVPTLWLGRGKDGVAYHSSYDSPAVCLPAPLRNNALLSAAWAYIMAELHALHGPELLAPVCAWIDEQLLTATQPDAQRLRRWAAGRILRDPLRWDVAAEAVEARASRYCDASAPPLDDLPSGGVRYRRQVWGTQNYEQAPPGAKRFGCWNSGTNAVLYWTDGERSVAAIDRLAAAELDVEVKQSAAEILEASVGAGLAERLK